MDTLDYLIIGLGIALIAIGLFLFISGKIDSKNPNHVEGFGIKLNVSNPSIVLIVFGIGLVLFPRLMPHGNDNDKATGSGAQLNADNFPSQRSIENVSQSLPAVDSNNQTSPSQTLPTKANNSPDTTNNNPQSNNLVTEQAQSQAQAQAQQPPATQAFHPQGDWYLTAYEENGMDLSNNIEGTIRFQSVTGNSQQWFADLVTIDLWGNMSNFQYSGVITSSANGYSIDIVNSNDPSFMRQAPTPLILKMDNPNSLHMEYFYNGSSIILHWSQ
uniref:hypothetical protein n=1 Tax=Ningiella ruwaisensis TaxID=2364274 RepID=UPI0010A0A98F|nr:hypothetical protein [Ningiella ruwaisensis]